MKTVKNEERVVIEYTCGTQAEKEAFVSSYLEVCSLLKCNIGRLSTELDKHDDLLIVFSTTLNSLAMIYYHMGATAERNTQHQNFRFQILRNK